MNTLFQQIIAASLLTMGVAQRIVWALAATALLWAAVFWAIN
jgi:hypothetical protein